MSRRIFIINKMKNIKIKENALLAEMPFEQEAPNTIAVFGYVKHYNKKIHLYYDLELLVYMEIDKGDVIAQQESDNVEEPSILYIKLDAKVREVIVPSNYRTIQNLMEQPTVEDLIEELINEGNSTEDQNQEFRRPRPRFPRRTRRLLRRFRRGRCFKWNW
ncbi:hypothetical protein [Aquimarina algiphila]|uniref:Uncharacterized protein n=1 Tax=Aquimarina algiphila TaxID=2047982 RepID=A0A554VJA7_9FLAO|nr:hypothetical protein [Aquimarina algiphila]TSE07994.1 hypothetical protein FOF46_13920 [Aquimarina algiphila]